VVAGLLLGALWCHWMFGGADAAREQSGNWATWRLPALAFVFPAGGIAVGLPVISEFVFAAALLMLAMTYGVRHAGDPLATRARLHFATLVGLLGMAIAAEVLQRLGNAPHALTVRLTLGGLLLAGGVAAGRLGHRFGATLCQASK
jgi:hypothetical protein